MFHLAIRTPRDLAHAIRAARTRAGLTQAQLARACGVRRLTIVRIEGGDQTRPQHPCRCPCPAPWQSISIGSSDAGQFSLAGAQAKLALRFDDDGWGVPYGTEPTTHILKPAAAGYEDQQINEHVCLAAARRAGLVSAASQLQAFGDELAIVVARYDRRKRTQGGWARIHQEDLCQALGVHPARKYEADGGPGVRTIGELLRAVMPPRAAETDVLRFLDALAWNWLIGGTDAHAKNYSLLLAADDVRLAPMYDVASALPYAHPRSLKLAMRLGTDYRLEPLINRWPAIADALGLAPDLVLARVDALAERTPEAFAAAAAETDADSTIPGRLTELVAERAAACRRLLASRS